LGKVRGLIRRMQRTIRHLKSFARKEAGDRSLIDLRLTIASALEMIAPRASAVGIMPDARLPDHSVLVMAGAVRIEQVAVNLLLNALDAAADMPDAQISIVLWAQDGHAHLRVSDTGNGITEEDLSRVAEPFFSTKLTGEGLGLGLAICKVILDDFGGTLDISSTQGRGTAVEVTLPLAPNE
jgi:two-component system C4-dicarboxylate transport sensor histidine kinase DctB